MITVILIMVPLTIPKLFGIRIYGVLTGSMTPAYSIGGVVYVSEKEPQEISVGDVITFQMGTNTEYVMTHRVVRIDTDCFVTKGDANNDVDPEPVSFDRLIGRVIFFLPGVAGVAQFVNSLTGRSVFVMLFATAFICWVVADMVSPDTKKEKKKDSAAKKDGLGIRLVGSAMIVCALVYLVSVFMGYRAAKNEYASLEQEVFGQAKEQDFSEADKAVTDNKEGTITLSETDKRVLQNIAALHEENEDVIGWIQFDTLDISYPIMQGKDNEYYLNHTFTGEENTSGSIFMDATNIPDFEDYHTIIYGHNMKNLSMFGLLKNYKKKDFYNGNEYFTIYSLNNVYRYRIFAYYDISMYGDLYNVEFGPDDYFQGFIDNMIKRSYYETGIRPVKTDKIMTLSTCSAKEKRFVINAVRINN